MSEATDEHRAWRLYWESPTGMANAPGGMVELARLHVNKLCDENDAQAARIEKLEADRADLRSAVREYFMPGPPSPYFAEFRLDEP